MKKLKLNGRLSLNKETVSRLTYEQMGAAKGGLLSIGEHCTHADNQNNPCLGTDETKGPWCSPHQ